MLNVILSDILTCTLRRICVGINNLTKSKKGKIAIGMCSIAMGQSFNLPSSRKTIYQYIVTPICNNAASIWLERLKLKTNREKLKVAEQLASCKMFRFQRTAKRELVLYLSNLKPIEMLIEERENA